MGALLSMISGGVNATGAVVSPLLGVVSSIYGYASLVLTFMFEMVLELGGYAFACVSLAFSLFTGCVSRATTEMIRPATEWKGSEASRIGPIGACCACLFVMMCILLCTVLIGFLVTYAWYETELIVSEEVSRVDEG
jgi:hypothetical protein